jgi:hypothetical protein
VGEANVATIIYRFHLPAGVEEIVLRFDPESFTLVVDDGAPAPDWAALEFSQCPHCPLFSADTPVCPFAHGLAGFVEQFAAFNSYDQAAIEIVTETRTVAATKPLQVGMASLVGLVGATSGCPHLAAFRPMARFHLPFARDDETLYRVFTMYLLGRYLADGALPAGPHALDGLIALHEAATVVNRSMADRVRAAFRKDVVVNAVVILDMFAQAVPFAIEDGLAELRAMFGIQQAAAS